MGGSVVRVVVGMLQFVGIVTRVFLWLFLNGTARLSRNA
jgi:hypothetical protein